MCIYTYIYIYIYVSLSLSIYIYIYIDPPGRRRLLPRIISFGFCFSPSLNDSVLLSRSFSVLILLSWLATRASAPGFVTAYVQADTLFCRQAEQLPRMLVDRLILSVHPHARVHLRMSTRAGMCGRCAP